MTMSSNYTHYSKLKEDLYHMTLPNGLQVFIQPKQGFSSKYAIFATHYGSNDNEFVLPSNGKIQKMPPGIAHFLEHKMFEEQEGNIFDRFAELGSSANAYTNYYMTAYLFSGTSNFIPSLHTLLDFVQNPYFTDENVEKEKGIIEQEIRMYDDHPAWCLQQNLLECLYHAHPVRVDIAGTVKTVNQVNKEMLYNCYHTFYHPSNMVLFLTGDIDHRKVLDEIIANQEAKQYQQQAAIQRIYPEEKGSVRCPESRQQLSIAIPLMAMGFKDPCQGLTGRALLKQEMLTNMVMHIVLGKSSALFNQLYEQGLITDDFSAGYNAQPDYAYSIMGCPTPQPEMLHQKLLKGLEDAVRAGISQEALERTRRKFMGLYTISYDNLSMIANRYVSYYIKGIDFFNYADILKDITLDEVNARLREHLNPAYHAVSYVLPLKEKHVF